MGDIRCLSLTTAEQVAMAGGKHAVQWSGCFRGPDHDPRETGWCEQCDREVYWGEDALHGGTP